MIRQKTNKKIILNWKMGLTSETEVTHFLNTIKDCQLKTFQLIILAPIFFLQMLNKNSLVKNDKIDIWSQKFTPFKHEKDLNSIEKITSYVKGIIVNHKDSIFHEKWNLIEKQIKLANKKALKILLCLGEKEITENNSLLEKQWTKILKKIIDKNLIEKKRLIIAYEPEWMISTEQTLNEKYLNEKIDLIKKIFQKIFNQEIEIVYGGGIKETNFQKYYNNSKLAGLLIGRWSWNPLNIKKISNIIEKIK